MTQGRNPSPAVSQLGNPGQCFFDDPADVGNLTSGSSAFSKTSLNIWKFMVHILHVWRQESQVSMRVMRGSP